MVSLQAKQYTGIWWLPENAENKIQGNLTYSYGQFPVLHLADVFDKNKDNGKFYEVIHGRVDGNKITLVDCIRENFSKCKHGSLQYFHSRFQVTVLFSGSYFSKKSEINFKSVNIKYGDLKEWIFHSLIPRNELNVNDSDEIVLTEKKDLKKEVIIGEYSIRFSGLNIYSSAAFYDKFQQDALISIIGSTILGSRIEFKTLIEIIFSVRGFLELMMGQKVSVLNISYYDDSDNKTEVYYPSFMRSKKIKGFHVYPVRFEDLINDLDGFLKGWFSFEQKYKPVYDLFFSLRDEKGYIRSPFLILSQAIEAYYSRAYANVTVLSEKKVKEIDNLTLFSEKIMENLAEEYRQFFMTRMQHINRKSLAMQMKDLRKFVDTRNYFTHYESGKETPSVSTILSLTDTLRFMIIAIILKEIGLKESEIKRAISIYYEDRVTNIYPLFRN